MPIRLASPYLLSIFKGGSLPAIRTSPLKTSALAVLLCLSTVAGWSQAPSALSGTVKDPTGAVVVQAVVTLTDAKTSVKKQATTNDAGAYSFIGLAPGNYTIEVLAPGFSTFQKQTPVGGEPATLDIALTLAQESGAVSVEAKIDPYNVVPTQPTQSIFGLDQKLEEIPRSISTADQETLLRYDVKTVNDIVTVSSGTYTGSYFGIPGSVFLRGDIGDNFFRGFRRVENRGNYQTPVAATDHIEIVKGPPSPIYGGGRIGGFLNFVPKTARSESAKWLEK